MKLLPHEHAPSAKRHLFRGRYMTAKDIAAALGLSYSAITYRLRKGLPLDASDMSRKGTPARLHLFRGEPLTAKAIAQRLGVSITTVRNRLIAGRYMEADEVAAMPCERGQHERLLFYRGRTMNVSEWARDVGMNTHTLLRRLDAGMSIHDALTTPVRDMSLRTMRARNRAIIRRIASVNLTKSLTIGLGMVNEPLTGGYPATFPLPLGTGAGSRAHHLQHATFPAERAAPSPTEV